MTDLFALLDEPRFPWGDPEILKKKFLVVSAQLHPDRVHSAPELERAAAAVKFSELNSAYRILGDPKERLRHFIEVERGRKISGIQTIPDLAADLFLEVGALLQGADQFLAERRKVSSPLLRAQLFAQGLEWAERLNQCSGTLRQRWESLLQRVRESNEPWKSPATPDERARLLDELELMYRSLAFLGRWMDQLQSRTVQLAE